MSKVKKAAEVAKTTGKVVGVAKETKKTIKKVRKFERWILPILLVAIAVGYKMVDAHNQGQTFFRNILFGVCSGLTLLFLLLTIIWIVSLVRSCKKRVKKTMK